MHPNAQLIERFYSAFQKRDGDGMAACYTPDVTFTDPVFPGLKGPRAGGMWRMLCERAKDLRKPPVRIEAMGSALHGRPSWDQFDDLTTMALRDAAAMMWARTDLTPDDVDNVELYDGFSFITLCWLEALGFAPHGEGGPFLAAGRPTAKHASLPLNTHGGQLSAGRLHGYGFLHEACVQLWGEGGARQVPGDPQVGLAAAGGGNTCGCMLLTRY